MGNLHLPCRSIVSRTKHGVTEPDLGVMRRCCPTSRLVLALMASRFCGSAPADEVGFGFGGNEVWFRCDRRGGAAEPA